MTYKIATRVDKLGPEANGERRNVDVSPENGSNEDRGQRKGQEWGTHHFAAQKDGNGDIKREKQYLKTGKCKPRREGKVVDEI